MRLKHSRSPKLKKPPKTEQNEPDIADRVDSLKRAVELADQRLSPGGVDFAEAIVAKSEERLRHGTTHLLVAFLGATGSGKSSLTNSVAGSEIATAGVRRPTTSSTLACIWGSADAQALLDWMGVASRHQVSSEKSELDGLVLLDVPDHDSIKVEHRLEMEQIAEHADLLIWITDPEKYADAALHEYLRQLSHHGAAMALVLNKSDQLSESEQVECQRDLVRLLRQDGITNSPVLLTSATEDGGASDLLSLIESRVADQASVMTRLEADVAAAASDLLAEVGDSKVKVSRVSSRVTQTLSEELSAVVGATEIGESVAAGYRRDANGATGWIFTRWTRRLRPHPVNKLHLGEGSSGRSSRSAPSSGQTTRALASIRTAADATTSALPEPWPRLVRNAAIPDESTLFDRLDVAVATAVREVRPNKPKWWSVAGWLQILLALATAVGGLWLLGLAGAAWLQLPELPTPKLGAIPIPTGLFLGGCLFAWIVAFGSRALASVGARRAESSVRSELAKAVNSVASELVISPIDRELKKRTSLVRLLYSAGARGQK